MYDEGPTFSCLQCASVCSFPSYAVRSEHKWRCPQCRAWHVLWLSEPNTIGSLYLVESVEMPAEGSVAAVSYESLREATLAINAGAPRAACVMLRRAVEQYCASLGGRGNLTQSIDSVRDKGHISPVTAAGLHAIRFLGNDAVHLELKHFDAINEEEALEAHALVLKLLRAAK